MPQDLPVRVIRLRAAAPAKPPEGAACNGCGVCCASAPCPMGVLLSRRRHGRCRALVWQEAQAVYRCGVIANPQRWLPWLPRTWAQGLARRWIAASLGCDASVTAG
jgi:hypothetical protein